MIIAMERERFEFWHRGISNCNLGTYTVGGEIHYIHDAVEDAWVGWQARAEQDCKDAARYRAKRQDEMRKHLMGSLPYIRADEANRAAMRAGFIASYDLAIDCLIEGAKL